MFEHIIAFFKHLRYKFKLFSSKTKKFFGSLSLVLLLFACLGTFTMLVYRIGFIQKQDGLHLFDLAKNILLNLFFWGCSLRYINKFRQIRQAKLFAVDISLYLLVILSLCVNYFFAESGGWFLEFLRSSFFSYALLSVLSFIYVSELLFVFVRKNIKPSILFIISFVVLISLGTALLLMPTATKQDISFVDTLFTATSAVCVTGLTTVDISQVFSLTGQCIILFLVQIGGIGVVTFTSFFALSFIGSASVGSELILKDMFNEKKIGNLFKVIIGIILISLFFEAIGAYVIYLSVAGFGENLGQDIYISIFYAISGYCNAGLSPLSESASQALAEKSMNFHICITVLVFLGSIGYPILLNAIKYLKNKISWWKKKSFEIYSPVQNIGTHTRLVLISTGILIFIPTAIFLFTQYNTSLAGMSLGEKISESFYYSVTLRTAGFASAQLADFTNASLFVCLIIMAIGASPMSTGGGIKTTSAAVAYLTAYSIIRGREEVEVGGRRLPRSIIRQAFSIIAIFISYVLIITIILCFLEPDKEIFPLLFEVVSATATVGSDLNVSANLCTASKYIIILSMFIGRIGVLMFFNGIIREFDKKRYEYPYDNVLLS